MLFGKDVLKNVLRAAVYRYVREEQQIEFLTKLYELVNQYGGSTFWGTIQDLLKEREIESFKEEDVETKLNGKLIKGSYWFCHSDCFVYDVYGVIKSSGTDDMFDIPWEIDNPVETFKMSGIVFDVVRISWLNNQYLIPREQFLACFQPANVDKTEWLSRVRLLEAEISNKAKLKKVRN